MLTYSRSVYKLTDFGAARELRHGDEEFMSLCGTEEYLVETWTSYIHYLKTYISRTPVYIFSLVDLFVKLYTWLT